MTRPSTDLTTVIAEAIQNHANHYRRGEPDRIETIAALAKLASDFAHAPAGQATPCDDHDRRIRD
jgi:hypothetical protein